MAVFFIYCTIFRLTIADLTEALFKNVLFTQKAFFYFVNDKNLNKKSILFSHLRFTKNFFVNNLLSLGWGAMFKKITLCILVCMQLLRKEQL